MPFHSKNINHRAIQKSQYRGASNYRGPKPKLGKKLFNDPSKFVNRIQHFQKETTYASTNSFSDFAFQPKLAKNIHNRNYTSPTPIQDQSIAHIMSGRDVIGLANTGTGKTAAFLLPLINKVLLNPHEHVLILAPTRELAGQINDEFKQFAMHTNLYSALCIGGVNIRPQIAQLRRRHNFVVATPGRLKDLMQQRILNISKYRNVVIDEVDQMFDMGFVKDVENILQLIPQPRHTLFFSATITPQIHALVNSHLQDPVKVAVRTRDTAESVDQDIIRLHPSEQKIDVLHRILLQEDTNKVLIFGRTKHAVQRLSEKLNAKGFSSEAIHGNRSQAQRQQALKKFKTDQVAILVATDIASRGLDIPNVSHVINYDLPETYEDYIHRIGRTGRANKLGKALTFLH
jgi:ATP-dependent RNA helicase RhlE